MTPAEMYENANQKGGVSKMTDKGMMYISTPSEIEEIIRKVPKGKLITTGIIADKLTQKHKVDFTCPMTTGIFSSIVAKYAEAQREEGIKRIAPWWRVVKPKGKLYDKYLGDYLPQREMLENEGSEVVEGKGKGKGKGKQPASVLDFEKYLVE